MAYETTDSSFESDVQLHKGYALVDFWAPWCGPCKSLSPIIDEIHSELVNKVKVIKMNIDANPEVAGKFGIRSIPTLILFHDGRQIDIKVGSLQKVQILQWLQDKGAII